MPNNQTPTGPQVVLNAQTTGSGIMHFGGVTNYVTVVLESTGTTSGGAVVIEEAYSNSDSVPYSGTWSELSSVNASSFTGGKQIAYHYIGSYRDVRCRISSTITGGGTIRAIVWGV